NALGRRHPVEPMLHLRVGDLVLDLVSGHVYRGSRQIELSPRELMLLKIFMREPGRVFTRTELCERVWEHQYVYDTKLVEVFVGRLRQKIGDPPLIRTVRYAGYTLGEASQTMTAATLQLLARETSGQALPQRDRLHSVTRQ
ncbi:MAG: winged helix-turn-helix transcriptional regulator, partial [Verrucomicrobia bacterium]|nr:winged helix-turn-helix transcriptional regulator [Verrucomicrobiota bacterium]